MSFEDLFHVEPLDIESVRSNPDRLLREFLRFCEYGRFPTDRLRQNYFAQLEEFLENENNFSISLRKNDVLKGYVLMEYMPFDSEIFEFNVYKISDFCFMGGDYTENELIIRYILDELECKVGAFDIKHLTISLNSNLPFFNVFLNCLMSNGFYYVNQLITFSMESENFERIKLYETNNNDINIRLADERDRDAVCEIAGRSYEIDRLHLDRNLDPEKCDLLYCRSAENSMLHGFADVVFVAEHKNEIVGYYSGRKKFHPALNANLGIAIIGAVAREARGSGIFSLMNNSMLRWFHENTDLAEMGTYLTNMPIQKTWIKNGLNIVRGTFQLARFFDQR